MSAPTTPLGTAAPARKHLATTNAKPNRLPAPSLFVGPPSRNASQLSVARQATDPNPAKPTRDPLIRHRSALSRSVLHGDDPRPGPSSVAGDASDHASKDKDKDKGAHPSALPKPSDRSIDAKWKEMQMTLNEVELTAQSSTHVFGASHSAALDDLRRAQIELARAWGRGNEERNAGVEAEKENAEGIDIQRYRGAEDLASDRSMRAGRARASTAESASTALSDESVLTTGEDSTGSGGTKGSGGKGGRGGASRLEDETAQDIRLASERRAANEAYFRKVDGSVKDVVARLQVVAEAMKGVEGESRSLWSESGSGRSAEDPAGKTEDATPDLPSESPTAYRSTDLRMVKSWLGYWIVALLDRPGSWLEVSSLGRWEGTRHRFRRGRAWSEDKLTRWSIYFGHARSTVHQPGMGHQALDAPVPPVLPDRDPGPDTSHEIWPYWTLAWRSPMDDPAGTAYTSTSATPKPPSMR
nr:hypothetical protein CFP56_09284 [Quercus suber]